MALTNHSEESMSKTQQVDIVFDGPPGPTAGRFVEAENAKGEGVSVGEWVKRDDGYWVLRLQAVVEPPSRPCGVPMWMNGVPAGLCGEPAFGKAREGPTWWAPDMGKVPHDLRTPYCEGWSCPPHGGPSGGEHV